MKPAQKGERTTLSAADWERAALDLIAEQGVQAMAIEPLARRMGITKGSFLLAFFKPRVPAGAGPAQVGKARSPEPQCIPG